MAINKLFIASQEPNAGSLFVSVGIMQLLIGRYQRVAFFRPIVELSDDSDISFMQKHFKLEQDRSEMYGLTRLEAESLLADGKENHLLELLILQIKNLEKRYDFVLMEGLSQESFNPSLSIDINKYIAKNLQLPYVSIVNAKSKSKAEIEHAVHLETTAIKAANIEHLALFINRIDETIYATLTKNADFYGIHSYYLPEIQELDRPSVGEVMHALNCNLIQGEGRDLDRLIAYIKIAAMNIEHLLAHMQEGELIIVPGDRVDVLLAVLSANYAKSYPSIAGIILTGALLPSPLVMQLIEGLEYSNVPILAIEDDTFSTAMKVRDVGTQIRPNRERKIAMALGSFMRHVDTKRVLESMDTKVSSKEMTPMMFEYYLYEKAKKQRKKIVLPESNDERILRAAEILMHHDVVDLVLLGDRETIMHKATVLGLNLEGVEIINPATSEKKQHYVDAFYNLRKSKGLSYTAAEDALSHITYFATMMLHVGEVDGMVSGAVHTTQDTIRPALQVIKAKEGISLISSYFLMCMPTRVLIFADCAINQDPDANDLADIAIASAHSAKSFDIEPKVAMLSYSTGSSGKGEDVQKVKEATEIVKQRENTLLIEGPIQYDAAIDKKVALKKLPNSKVAGGASVFIFPDLNTGNNTYKAVQRSANAIAIGPILQGLNKPVNDLSRGCEVADIVNTVLITAIQAQEI